LKWSELPLPWQECWEEGWASCRAGSMFIGAVVTDGEGRGVARGRNHLNDCDALPFQVRHNQLAHAELNALLWLSPKPADVHTYHIYSLLEPCPMCMGAIYMSGVRAVHYAARDPWAGSADILGKTLYLSRKPLKIFVPDQPELEQAVVAMGVSRDLLYQRPEFPPYDEALRAAYPQAVALGRRLAAEQLPLRWRAEGWDAGQVFDQLMESTLR
jgi:tRNA(Arg) A34 adenosine deaminase TadA